MALETTTAAGSVVPTAVILASGQTEAMAQYQNSTDIAAFMPAMSIESALARWDAIKAFISKIMADGEDYGVIPGSKKPCLLKPGAEKLTAFFGLVPTFDIDQRIEDWDGSEHSGEPFFYYRMTCRLSRNGILMGSGQGSCNSREAKYRWRDAERKCPMCSSAAIIKGKAEYGGGWLCFRKKGGCGATFPDGSAQIEAQQTGRVPNPDIADVVNTILKMAEKRAKIDAVLNTTGASQFFTQDVEDLPLSDDAYAPYSPKPSPSAEPPRTAAEAVAERKIAQLASDARRRDAEFPTQRGEIKQAFREVRERVGETRWNQELALLKIKDPLDLKYLDKMRDFWRRLDQIAKQEAA